MTNKVVYIFRARV